MLRNHSKHHLLILVSATRSGVSFSFWLWFWVLRCRDKNVQQTLLQN
jgi:hypothetical protein